MSVEIVPVLTSFESTSSCPPSPVSSIDSAHSSSIDNLSGSDYDRIAVSLTIATMSEKSPSLKHEDSKQIDTNEIMKFESNPSSDSSSPSQTQSLPADCPIFRPMPSTSPRHSRKTSGGTPSTSPTPKSPSRTKRIPLNHTQKMILETFYALNQYPNRTDKHELSERIGLDVDKVHKWFDNRRTKANKDRRGGVEFPYAGAHNVARAFGQVASPSANQPHGQGQALNWYASTSGQQPMNNTTTQPEMQTFSSQSMMPSQSVMQSFVHLSAMMPFQQTPQQAFDASLQNLPPLMHMRSTSQPQPTFPVHMNPLNQTTSMQINQHANQNQVINQPIQMNAPFMLPSEAFANFPQFNSQSQFAPATVFDPFTNAASISRQMPSMVANPVGSYSMQPTMGPRSFSALNCSTLPPSVNSVAPQWFNAPTNQSIHPTHFQQQPSFQQMASMQQVPSTMQRPELSMLSIPPVTNVASQSKPRSPNSAFSVVPRKHDSNNPTTSLPQLAAPTAIKRQRVELVANSGQVESSIRSQPSISPTIIQPINQSTNQSLSQLKQSPARSEQS